MTVYIDTGILANLYCAEVNSPDAVALIVSQTPPLALTAWQELEVVTAWRLKLFRREINAGPLQMALDLAG
jgi:hypothetical protein